MSISFSALYKQITVHFARNTLCDAKKCICCASLIPVFLHIQLHLAVLDISHVAHSAVDHIGQQTRKEEMKYHDF